MIRANRFARIALRIARATKETFGECTLVPVFVPGEHANVASFRFSFRGNMRTYPRSGFRSGEHPPKPPFFGNHPFVDLRCCCRSQISYESTLAFMILEPETLLQFPAVSCDVPLKNCRKMPYPTGKPILLQSTPGG